MARKERPVRQSAPTPVDAAQMSWLTTGRMLVIAAASMGMAFYGYVLIFRIPALGDAITDSTARITALMLVPFRTGVTAQGSVLQGANFNFGVGPDCTALPPIALLLGAILAFPSSPRAKLTGALLGILFLNVLNLVRVMSLVYIGTHFPGAIDLAHEVIWQAGMILATVVFWIVWLQRSRRAERA